MALPLFFLIFFSSVLQTGFSQAVTYSESCDISIGSTAFVQANANPSNWNALDLVDLRPFQAKQRVEKTVRDDGSFSIVTVSESDSRFEVASGRPKSIIVDQVGIRATSEAGVSLFDLTFGGDVLSQVPDMTAAAQLAKIGKYPNFQTPTSAEIAEWQADGWQVSMPTAQKVTLTRTAETTEIFLAEHRIRTVHFEQGQEVANTETQYISIGGKYFPSVQTETEHLTLSNGDCATCITSTYFTNYSIAGERSAPSQKLSGNAALKITPNPVTEEMTVNLPPNAGQMEIWVFNQVGQVVQKQIGNFGQSVQMPTADLKSGIYFLTVFGEGLKQTTRFVKQ